MLIRKPEVIVLDEATSAMDSKWEEMAIKDMGDYLGTGKILVNISHRLSSIKSCGEIMLLENGSIRKTGSFQEMLGNDLFKKIFASQINEIEASPGY
jgi:ABC-type bacteriocin/lantibiotic exporter with double-glycine peptidase domain